MNLTPEQLRQFANDELSLEEFRRLAQQLRSLSSGALHQMFVQGGIKIDGNGNVIGHGNIILSGDGAKALVDLYREILERDRALHQLPAPPADFTGRTTELDDLLAASKSGSVLISGIQGMGGIGKTALALKVAEHFKDRYPDAQFFLDLQGVSAKPLASRDAMAHVIRAYEPLYQMPEHEAEVRGKYLSVLHNRRALLVLDNAAGEEQVAPLLPPASCGLLVTSRQHFTLDGMWTKRLSTMSTTEASDLLLRIAPRIGEHAGKLAELCGYLPLALRLVASALKVKVNLKPEAYAKRLEDTQTRLQILDKVEAALQLSYDLLRPDQQRVWCKLSVMRGTFNDAAAAAVLELSEDDATDKLGDLLAYSLVEWNDGTSRYRLHDLARLFADTRLSDEERAIAQQLHSAHYQAFLADADNLYERGHEAVMQGITLFELEWRNIAAGQQWAAEQAEKSETAAQLAIDYSLKGGTLLTLRQHSRERIAWLESALTAARQLAQRGNEGAVLGSLGLAYRSLGEFQQSIIYSEQALTIMREIGGRYGESRTLANLGAAYMDLGEFQQAIDCSEQALTIMREIGDRHGEGRAIMNLGTAYAYLGKVHQAIDYFEQYVTIAREIGDRQGEGKALDNLGVSCRFLGEVHQAITYHEQSLAIAREIGDRQAEGQALGNLGATYLPLGERRRASDYFEKALMIMREIADRRSEGRMLDNLGLAYRLLGEIGQALDYHDQALMIARAVGDRQGESNALGNLGNSHFALGEFQRAIIYQEQHLTIAQEIRNRQGEGRALGDLGVAYYRLGEVQQAVDYFERQVTIAREIGDRQSEGTALGNLGVAYRILGEGLRAFKYFGQHVTIAREIGDRQGEGNALHNMSLVFADLGEAAQSIAYAQAALAILEEIEAPNAVTVRQELAAWLASESAYEEDDV